MQGGDPESTNTDASDDVDGTQTKDDLDIGWGERLVDEAGHDAWLRAQRPPHWE